VALSRENMEEEESTWGRARKAHRYTSMIHNLREASLREQARCRTVKTSGNGRDCSSRAI